MFVFDGVLSKELKMRGWKFASPTMVFAFMQATGPIDHHVDGCGGRKKVIAARAAFVRP